ncbi:hypothetical protein CKO09_01805 [Chromatium weissei]|nr:hypothetical protein [Chromatium weissei]
MRFLSCVIQLILTSALLANTARAEVQLSGFGTFGAAISNRNFLYQRFIDNDGTVERDSLLGIQLDARLTPAWGLTLQTKLAPSMRNDNDWKTTLSWAFLSWRLNDDVLIRAGKLRLPMMLYSANSDIGTTFVFNRLPIETYSLLPMTDLNGLSIAKTWLNGTREWTLEGYIGATHTEWRYYLRDDMPPLFNAGSLFLGYDCKMLGAVLSLRERSHLWSIGIHRTQAFWDAGPSPTRFPFVNLIPNTDIGYYKIVDSMPGSPIQYDDYYDIYFITLGAKIALPGNIDFTGEYARRGFANAVVGADTHAAYFALSKRIQRWTPYIYWSGIRSRQQALDLMMRMNRNRIPEELVGAQQAAILNTTQRAGADLLAPYNQYSLAIGTAYHLSPKAVIKAEWLYTRTGVLSSFINAPTDEDSGGREINVFSLSYSLTF